MTEQLRLCLVECGGVQLGLDAVVVREITTADRYTQVPLAPEAVRGLLNLRGTVVPILDVRALLGMEPRPEGQECHQVIVETEHDAVALEVDQATDLVTVPRRNATTVPENMTAVDASLLMGMVGTDDGLVLVVNIPALLTKGFGAPAEGLAR